MLNNQIQIISNLFLIDKLLFKVISIQLFHLKLLASLAIKLIKLIFIQSFSSTLTMQLILNLNPDKQVSGMRQTDFWKTHP